MKDTTIFDQLVYDAGKHTLPSLQPPVHIFTDAKADVQKYDWISLAKWTLKRSQDFVETLFGSIDNPIQITGHVA